MSFAERGIGRPNRNRTCNCPLGGGRYIHLTIGRISEGLKLAQLMISVNSS